MGGFDEREHAVCYRRTIRRDRIIVSDWQERQKKAREETDPMMLDRWADHEYGDVAKAVAENTHTLPETLTRLAGTRISRCQGESR